MATVVALPSGCIKRIWLPVLRLILKPCLSNILTTLFGFKAGSLTTTTLQIEVREMKFGLECWLPISHGDYQREFSSLPLANI